MRSIVSNPAMRSAPGVAAGGRWALSHGEEHPEGAAFAWLALHHDAAAEARHDSLADGQPQPRAHPRGLRSEERIEQPVQVLRSNARPRVLHLHDYLALTL